MAREPVTLAIAAVAVIGGPLLGIVHVATASEDDEEPAAEPRFVARRGRAAAGAPHPAGRPRQGVPQLA